MKISEQEQATQVLVRTNQTPQQIKELVENATANGVRLLVFATDYQRITWRSRIAKLQESQN